MQWRRRKNEIDIYMNNWKLKEKNGIARNHFNRNSASHVKIFCGKYDTERCGAKEMHIRKSENAIHAGKSKDLNDFEWECGVCLYWWTRFLHSAISCLHRILHFFHFFSSFYSLAVPRWCLCTISREKERQTVA